MATNDGHPTPLSTTVVRTSSHSGMQGLSSVAASRLLASLTRESTFKDNPGGYDFGELQQPLHYSVGDDPAFPDRNSGVHHRISLNLAPGGTLRFDNNTSKGASSSLADADSRSLSYSLQQHVSNPSFESPSSQQFDAWAENNAAKNSPETETSADAEPDRKTEAGVSDSLDDGTPRSSQNGDLVLMNAKSVDSKVQRRLAQNREAARKSRLRKKAYVQQLENSRMRLNQLEQELQRARQQGFFINGSFSSDQNVALGSSGMSNFVNSGAMAFDMEYSRWLEEHTRQTNDLRTAVNNHASDNELRILVDAAMAHYDEVFRLKSIAAKADVFHLLSGMWKTPAERCFLWMGGHRPSELLKILTPQVEPLSEQQVLGICNLQQSAQQAEDALSQGMDNLQQSLAETLSTGFLGTASTPGNVANYMGQMAMAMGKLGTFESFVRQADLLRQQTLQQLHRILTTRQAARVLLAKNDYFSRLRALSSLWMARPRD